MEVSTSPILWQNEDQTATLIDIPRSIAAAQGTEEHQCFDTLLSSPAVQLPFTTNEPKSAKARSHVKANTVDTDLQHDYGTLLQHALESIRSCHQGPWYLGRSFTSDSTGPRQKKRKHSRTEDGLSEASLAPSKFECLASKSAPKIEQSSNTEDDALFCSDCNDPGGNFHCNPSALPIKLHQVGRSETTQDDLCIPPRSSFYIGNCAESRGFHTCVRNQAQVHDSRRHFDFILLDPPWPNSSVKRTHKTPGSTYATISTLEGVSELLLSTDLDMLMADECLVGFWITNRPAVRELLLGQDGIFAAWSLQLEEEWIWLKTTAHGLPVTPIDGCWRKPYEVLLLGRRHARGTHSHGSAVSVPKRRVVVGVPDLHSRKPCLKTLIEPLMRSGTNYRALEVFARHLAADWWSWGNECTKFNVSSYWGQNYTIESNE